jgi:hypothetical protein
LLFPVRPHVDVAATRTALAQTTLLANDGTSVSSGYLETSMALMSARIIEAGGDEMMHAEMAHVA